MFYMLTFVYKSPRRYRQGLYCTKSLLCYCPAFTGVKWQILEEEVIGSEHVGLIPPHNHPASDNTRNRNDHLLASLWYKTTRQQDIVVDDILCSATKIKRKMLIGDL